MNKFQKIALAQADMSVKDLGFKLDRHAGYISDILSGHHRSPRLRKEIARILNKHESYLWPDEGNQSVF